MNDSAKILQKVKIQGKLAKQSFFFLLTQHVRSVILILFPFFLLIFFLGLVRYNTALREEIEVLSLLDAPITITPVDYPFLATAPDPLLASVLTAQGAVVMDNGTKIILFSKNPKQKFSMASTTKLMTALTALDHFKLYDVLTVRTDNVAGVNVGIKAGQQFFFIDLLYAMLLPSGNDAAAAIAQNYPGGEEAFVSRMNENARKYFLHDTNFSDPAGLDDAGDYTSPIDLALLSSKVLERALLAQIVATRSRTIADTQGEHVFQLYNLNRLLGEDGVVGLKTGFTDIAGGVLATAKTTQGHTLLFVVMKSEDRFTDTKRLIDIFSGVISYKSIRQ